MKRYNIFHPLYMSFYSKSLYNDVGRNWKGVAFAYLLFLMALCWLPLTIKMHLAISDFITDYAPQLVAQAPPVKITKGEVSVDVRMPYVITDPKTKAPSIIIDTTGQTTSLEGSNAFVLLTKNTIVTKSKTETRIFSLSDVKDFYIDQSRINDWLAAFKSWFAIAAYPFLVLFSFLYRIIQVLIYAAIGLLFAKVLKKETGYQALVRMSVMAITPVVILNTVVDLTGARLPLWGLICFVIAMGYLFFAVKAHSEEEVFVEV